MSNHEPSSGGVHVLKSKNRADGPARETTTRAGAATTSRDERERRVSHVQETRRGRRALR